MFATGPAAVADLITIAKAIATVTTEFDWRSCLCLMTH